MPSASSLPASQQAALRLLAAATKPIGLDAIRRASGMVVTLGDLENLDGHGIAQFAPSRGWSITSFGQDVLQRYERGEYPR